MHAAPKLKEINYIERVYINISEKHFSLFTFFENYFEDQQKLYIFSREFYSVSL